ncbi:hypothetical protein PUR71_33200 [Streptomyces sp. SP17BM10]|uniref:hypothetical protein n=1 Tax=Streptomyces sp. SP17BM10 TaxID=3002530 RepID=UPI002E76745F|nr:hypothetical protein [Streptomyces sp. SP17BM10]MEE1787729.1 hypothetical protein [Streptomyces sp. SP17BM10]
MSGLNEYRAERRADRQAERADARADLREEREQARLDAEAARQRREADQRAVEEARDRRRAARAARFGRVTGWVVANPARAFVRLVQACSIVPAVVSQVAALDHADVALLLAVLLAAMLEGGAWALVAMGAQAEGERSTRTYRLGAWMAGLVAGVINFAHGWTQYPAHHWVAFVLALSSIGAVWLTDLQTHGGRGPTAAEKKQAKERAEHARRRAAHHPEVKDVADRLLSAAPYGALSADGAWRIAWEYVHGVTTPGLTADLLAQRLNARARVAELSVLPAPADLWPGMPDDPFPALTLPLPVGPSDGVYLDAVPDELRNASPITSEALEALYGTGSHVPAPNPDRPANEPPATATGNASGPAGERPLDPADLARVRVLAADLAADGEELSTRKVRTLLGCRNETAVRLRAAVLAERNHPGNDTGKENAQ